MEDAGFTHNTYFILTSDHGDMRMQHQQFYKMVPWEASSRVPLVIAGPGVVPGKVYAQPASLLDIYASKSQIITLRFSGRYEPDLNRGPVCFVWVKYIGLVSLLTMLGPVSHIIASQANSRDLRSVLLWIRDVFYTPASSGAGCKICLESIITKVSPPLHS